MEGGESGPFKVLVTGASGYIASHVVQTLLEAGHVVRGTVRSTTDEKKVGHLKQLKNAGPNLELVEADLVKASTWPQAVQGVTHVIHVASPFPSELGPEERVEEELLRPAVEGTLNVLRACVGTPSVRRVVLTSSTNAVYWTPKACDVLHTEREWSDIDQLDSYSKSKTLAEKAAWDFIANMPADRQLELAVVNPTMVLGPPLNPSQCTATLVMRKLLDKQIPAIPKLNHALADVRDVALAHVIAMTSPAAAGHRHIVCSGNMWLGDIAALLKSVFKSRGYDIPTTPLPGLMVKMASMMDKSLQAIVPHLGLVHKYDNTRMREVLGIEPRDMRDTVVEMAHAMIELGLAHRSDKYSPHQGAAERDRYLALRL